MALYARTAVRVEGFWSNSSEKKIELLGQIAERPTRLSRMLRKVVSETFLDELRKSFLRDLPQALNMQTESVTSPRKSNTPQEHELASAYNDLHDAMFSDKGAPAVAEARASVEKKTEVYHKSLSGGYAQSSLSSGLFRYRALEIMRLLTDAKLMRTSATETSVSVHIGDFEKIEKIKTPSATQYILHKGHTPSPYDTLWRHLEFGTGVYGQDPEHKSEGWRYGRIFFIGSPGMHTLHVFYTLHSGVIYDRHLFDVFTNELVLALGGI